MCSFELLASNELNYEKDKDELGEGVGGFVFV